MYGLNDEPTWRSAWTARLNFDCSKSRPPTMALTSPVELSRASSAPCTPDSCSSDTRLSRPFSAMTFTYTRSPRVKNCCGEGSEEHTSGPEARPARRPAPPSPRPRAGAPPLPEPQTTHAPPKKGEGGGGGGQE